MIGALHKNTKELEEHKNNPQQQSPTKRAKDGSPVKTVLGALTRKGGDQVYSKSKHINDKLNPPPPESIEDVPFRRQDRRILNARKKRVSDRKLIKCILFTGIVMIIAGLAFVISWAAIEDAVDQLLITGAVVAGFGIFIMFFSVEVCIRLQKNAKRVKDPEIDRLTNLHHIKHWVHPELINFGWGQVYDEEPPPEGQTPSKRSRRSNGGAEDRHYNNAGNRHSRRHPPPVRFEEEKSELASSRGGGGINMLLDMTPPTSAGQIRVKEEGEDCSNEDLNPHEAMAIEMENLGDEEVEAEQERRPAQREEESIPKDIFDESMRYCDVNRPKAINIEPSSPIFVKQYRGVFQTEEDRIANLFSPKK